MRYAAKSVGRVLLFAGTIFVVLLGVFAVERFEFLLSTALQHRLNLFEFATLLFSFLPSITDYIIPIAALVTVYFVLLRNRENREFVVLASADLASRQLLWLTGTISLGAFLFSLGVSGFIKPHASYIYRTTYSQVLEHLVERGPKDGMFVKEEDAVLYVAEHPTSESLRARVFLFDKQRLHSVFGSECADIRIENGLLFSDQCDISGVSISTPFHEGAVVQSDCTICPDPDSNLRIVRIKSGRSFFELALGKAFQPVTRDRRREKSLGQLFETTGSSFTSASDFTLGFQKTVLALVSSLAVTIAVLTLAATTAATVQYVLPVAIAGVTVLSSLAYFIDPLPVVGTDWRLAIVLGLVAVVLVAFSLPLVIVGFQRHLIKPGLRQL